MASYHYGPTALHPNAPSPLRRQNAAQPPMLVTASLNNAHQANPGLGLSVPPSTTSLSTPFSPFAASPYAQSPASASVSSPMALRSAASYTAPYNPQQWGRINPDGQPAHLPAQQARTVVYAPRLTGPDEPMVSPPPPYSAEPNSPSPAETMSPGTIFSQGTAPSSAATTMSPGATVINTSRHSPGPPSAQANSPATAQAAFPPPPGPNPRIRSSSRNHADRLLATINIRGRNTSSPGQANVTENHPQNTSEALHRTEPQRPTPPGSRRAASTGALDNPYAPPYSQSPIQPDRGFAIPPPPPGPPPPSSRSQSCQPNEKSPAINPTANVQAPRNHIRLGQAPTLDAVPPTPADWRDDSQANNQGAQPSGSTWTASSPRVDNETTSPDHFTASPSALHSPNADPPSSAHARRESTSGLIRSPAVRNRSAMGIRERRSESKARGDPASPAASPVLDALSRPLADLVVAPDGSGKRDTIAGRRASTRTTPKSAQFRGLDEALRSADSAHSTPRYAGDAAVTPTPPFSAGGTKGGSLPTSPLYPDQRPGAKTGARQNAGRAHAGSIDDALYPNQDAYLDIENPASRNAFADRALERHRIFSEKEAAAANDSERLHLFLEFVVAESRLRRDRYHEVFQEEEVDVQDLLQGMFEARSERESTKDKEALIRTSYDDSRPSSGTSFVDSQQNTSRRTSTNATSDHPIALTLDTSFNEPRQKNYVPCLSPIASAVTGRDELESRGRTPSRWWESQSSASNEGFNVMERSKRETKYMSAMINLQVPEQPSSSAAGASSPNRPPWRQPGSFGINEHPPENGVQESGSRQASGARMLAAIPESQKLDIQRLITLPPPYPRRYPAVNNNHPDLADVRAVVRSLSELSEVTSAEDTFASTLAEKTQKCESLSKHYRSLHDQDIAFRMQNEDLTQDDFDAAEAALETRLQRCEKDLAQSTLDLFTSLVFTRLHTLYAARIERATAAFDALAARLVSDVATHSPNIAQEAGDGQPELLERLTALKWLFDARESLQRAAFDLLTTRNDHYKALVRLPYTQARPPQAEKVADTDAFFAQDVRQRLARAAAEARARWQALCAAIEHHVTRGVEVQSAAFWDIAPPLTALLQRVPGDPARLARFAVRVPGAELAENPEYGGYPLRYLYSVLAHAEASSRQFVAGQVDLWCLLQEVKEGAVGARWRAEGASRAAEGQGSGEEGWKREAEGRREAEVKRGLEDLKEKVAAVEGQWVEGLGGEIGRVRGAVRGWLEETGGWDEELEELEGGE